jgi:hypothetical protein
MSFGEILKDREKQGEAVNNAKPVLPTFCPVFRDGLALHVSNSLAVD